MVRRPTTRVLALVTALATAGCAGSTTIRSNPPGATVYLDGTPVGTTPYEMSDRKITGSKTRVRLERAGYQPTEAVISRNEEVDVGALIGGLFFVVPFLWILEYEPDHYYQLRSAEGGTPAGADPAPKQGPSGSQRVAERARRAAELNAKGRELMKDGDAEAAVTEFRAATRTFQDPRYFFNLCVALDTAGQAREAITACEQVFENEPSQRLGQKTEAFLRRLQQN